MKKEKKKEEKSSEGKPNHFPPNLFLSDILLLVTFCISMFPSLFYFSRTMKTQSYTKTFIMSPAIHCKYQRLTEGRIQNLAIEAVVVCQYMAKRGEGWGSH